MLAQAKHGSRDMNQIGKSGSSNSAQDIDTQMGGMHGRDLSAISDGKDGTGSDSGKSEVKPNTRSRGKKTPVKKQVNGRRKADAAPAGKSPAAKRSRASSSMQMDDDDDDEDEEDIENEHMVNGKDTRKMTDEEKRKNFLERNRVAALKCRQRKKQWLANLQTKVEIYTTENDSLNQQVQALRQEVVSLKTILLAHKDCPVTQSQGLTAMSGMGGMNDFNGNPYMTMTGRGQVMAGQGSQRRFS